MNNFKKQLNKINRENLSENNKIINIKPKKEINKEEIIEVFPENTHLIIFDMRFLLFSDIPTIVSKLNKSNKIYLIKPTPKKSRHKISNEDIYLLNQKESKIDKKVKKLQKKHNLEYIVVKNPNDYINGLKIENKDYKLITIINNVNLRTSTKIKNKSPHREKKKKRINTFELESKGKTKVIKFSNLILWDIENIAYSQIDRIFNKLNYFGKLYIVSVEEISKKGLKKIAPFLAKYDIEIITGHDDSDEKIKDIILDEHSQFKKVTVISNDTDFIPILNNVLEQDKKIKVIMKDIHKKGMIMRLKLDNTNIELSTI